MRSIFQLCTLILLIIRWWLLFADLKSLKTLNSNFYAKGTHAFDEEILNVHGDIPKGGHDSSGVKIRETALHGQWVCRETKYLGNSLIMCDFRLSTIMCTLHNPTPSINLNLEELESVLSLVSCVVYSRLIPHYILQYRSCKLLPRSHNDIFYPRTPRESYVTRLTVLGMWIGCARKVVKLPCMFCLNLILF